MRKAFTVVELMIVVAIIAIIAAIAIPNLIEARNYKTPPHAGDYRMWHNHRAYIIATDTQTLPNTYLIRLEDNKELRVGPSELTPDTAVEKP